MCVCIIFAYASSKQLFKDHWLVWPHHELFSVDYIICLFTFITTILLAPSAGWYHATGTQRRLIPHYWHPAQVDTTLLVPSAGWHHATGTQCRLIPHYWHPAQIDTTLLAPSTDWHHTTGIQHHVTGTQRKLTQTVCTSEFEAAFTAAQSPPLPSPALY